MGPHPAVAATRSAVRRALEPHPNSQGVVVACSGGADSVALAAATAFECNRTSRAAAFVTVDHGLQTGSAEHARDVARLGLELGFDPVHLIVVEVGKHGGPEAAARAARYEAIDQMRGDALVLLGHTADDQAETVLLGLGRGSGPRAIAGMRGEAGNYVRPFLGLRRADTEAACRALGLSVWHDPHNADVRYRRVRLRTEVLPLLEDVLAGGVTDALARTASQMQDDLDTLDVLVDRILGPSGGCRELSAARLAGEPPGLVRRALKTWAERAGAGPLTTSHVVELGRLVFNWHGQGPIDLPGGFRAVRSSGRLSLQATPTAATPDTQE